MVDVRLAETQPFPLISSGNPPFSVSCILDPYFATKFRVPSAARYSFLVLADQGRRIGGQMDDLCGLTVGSVERRIRAREFSRNRGNSSMDIAWVSLFCAGK
jgi:hypothetical protein